MWTVPQIRSQMRQVFLFRKVLPLRRVLEHMVFFPFDYYSRHGKARFPLAINFLVTSHCNLKCEMCNYEKIKMKRELTVKEIEKFFRREHGEKFNVLLLGGEPFMRHDIFTIIDIIKKYGFTCGICTNGVLLNEEKIKALILLGVDYMIFSLHGPRDVHDGVTGVRGSFDKLVSNMRLFATLRGNKKVKLITTCVITTSNMHALVDCVHIAQEMGTDIFRFEHLNFLTQKEIEQHNHACLQEFPFDPIEINSHYIVNEIHNGEQYYKNLLALMNNRSSFTIPVYIKPFLNKKEISGWYANTFSVRRKCVFVWESLFVNPAGDIWPCQFLTYKLGNIQSDRLSDVWNSSDYRKLRLKLKKQLFPGCARCCKL